jgi:GTP:adenosylcobinamide-phosphate guanylyltransferase
MVFVPKKYFRFKIDDKKTGKHVIEKRGDMIFMNGDKIILVIDNVRVAKYNSENIVVERLEKVPLFQGKGTGEKWVFKGYYSTIRSAVLAISRLELLLNVDDIKDIQSLLEQIKESNDRLIEATDDMCSTCLY